MSTQLPPTSILPAFLQAAIEWLGKFLGSEPCNLVKDNNDDPSAYTLREGADGAWIRIKNIDIRVRSTDEGVVVDLYAAHQTELEPTLGSTYAYFAEAEEAEADEVGGK